MFFKNNCLIEIDFLIYFFVIQKEKLLLLLILFSTWVFLTIASNALLESTSYCTSFIVLILKNKKKSAYFFSAIGIEHLVLLKLIASVLNFPFSSSRFNSQLYLSLITDVLCVFIASSVVWMPFYFSPATAQNSLASCVFSFASNRRCF